VLLFKGLTFVLTFIDELFVGDFEKRNLVEIILPSFLVLSIKI